MNKLLLIFSLLLAILVSSCGNSSTSKITPTIESKKNEQEKLKVLTDSLNSMRSELENLKNPISSDSLGDCSVPSDGSYYKSVKIGNQTWMTENLNVTTFRNGDPIQEAKTSRAWDEAASSEYAAFCYTPDGILYNWYAVSDFRGLAPEGWHIPKREEWRELEVFLGDKGVASKKMKTTNGWRWEGNGSNESGFSGYPGGIRGGNGEYDHKGYKGFWWSASEDYYFQLYYNHSMDLKNINSGGDNGWGMSVRCVKD